MAQWRQRGDIWQLESSGGARGTIEFIGGSYLAATPQLSYRRLLEALAVRCWWIHAWSYVPGFDHQSQANDAWRCLRRATLLLRARRSRLRTHARARTEAQRPAQAPPAAASASARSSACNAGSSAMAVKP